MSIANCLRKIPAKQSVCYFENRLVQPRRLALAIFQLWLRNLLDINRRWFDILPLKHSALGGVCLEYSLSTWLNKAQINKLDHKRFHKISLHFWISVPF